MNKIDVEETAPGLWRVTVGGIGVLSSNQKGVVERTARIVSEARNRPYREGIKMLIEEIGFDEDFAKEVYHEIYAHRNSHTVQ